ncbi:MAG: hypothetical protein HY323_02020 [Betaproteobacteria bacterium]|nr:hypothetical protein [Betaproteobacteria bacterium]
MKTGIIAFASLLVPAALALVSTTAPAQTYPTKPLRLIVPWPPGGGTDAAARILAQAFSEDPGWQLVVDNRGGASGRIGTELAAKAPADGYTLVMGTVAPNAILPAASSKLPYRHGEGLRADQPGRHLRLRARRTPVAAGKIGQGPDCARQKQTGADQLRFRRQWFHGAPCGRAVQAARQGGHGARGVQGWWSCRYCDLGRRGVGILRQRSGGGAAREGRQAESDRHQRREALKDVSGTADRR